MRRRGNANGNNLGWEGGNECGGGGYLIAEKILNASFKKVNLQ
jgi:hypothetical protein